MCAICCQLLWDIPWGIEMVSVCTVRARGGRSCEHFGGYKTINRIPFGRTKGKRGKLGMGYCMIWDIFCINRYMSKDIQDFLERDSLQNSHKNGSD